MGQITNWNDPAIKALNPRARRCPDLKITPVFRSDGSGTTYNFTDYLSAVSAELEDEVGTRPAGQLPGRASARAARPASPASSPARRARSATSTPRSRSTNHIKFAAIQNAAGKFLFPSLRRIAAAAARVHEGAGEQRAAHRQPAEVGAARVPDRDLHLRHRPQADAHAAELRKMIFWALTQGQKQQYAAKLDSSSKTLDRSRCSSPRRRR